MKELKLRKNQYIFHSVFTLILMKASNDLLNWN